MKSGDDIRKLIYVCDESSGEQRTQVNERTYSVLSMNVFSSTILSYIRRFIWILLSSELSSISSIEKCEIKYNHSVSARKTQRGGPGF